MSIERRTITHQLQTQKQALICACMEGQVKDVSFYGVFRIALTPLVDELPCFGAITVALSAKVSSG